MPPLQFHAHRFMTALFVSFSVSVEAQDSAAMTLPDSLGLSTNLIEVTFNLLIVLAAILIFAWIFKRAQGIGQPAAGLLRVAATLPLGPKERILLVEVGEEQIVLAASAAGINALHVLKQPLDLPQVQSIANESQGESFKDRLKQALQGAKSS